MEAAPLAACGGGVSVKARSWGKSVCKTLNQRIPIRRSPSGGEWGKLHNSAMASGRDAETPRVNRYHQVCLYSRPNDCQTVIGGILLQKELWRDESSD